MAKGIRGNGSIIAMDLVAGVRALVEAKGPTEAATLLQIDVSTVARCVGGMWIRRGTAVQVRVALAELERRSQAPDSGTTTGP